MTGFSSDTEVVAIYNTLTKRYLVDLNYGIGFSSRETHEWILRHRKGADFSLYNIRQNASLRAFGEEVYFGAREN